jgi:chaperonin GroEL
MPKQFRFADEAHEDLKTGMDVLAKVVGTTLGPKGRNVAMEQQNARWMTPKVSHDGATVARWIELDDPFQDMGTQLVKAAAMRTNEMAGDGTTTATVLAQAIVNEAVKNIAAGSNPMLIRRGVEKAALAVIEAIRREAVEVKSEEEITQVATISGHDAEIGELIGGVMAQLGKDGVITIQDGQTMGFEVETVTGMRLDRRGYLSRHFITNPVTREAVIEDAYILMYDGTIKESEELVPAMERLAQAGKRNLVVVADNVDRAPMAMLAANKARGHFNCLAIRAPGLGIQRIEMMEDLATFVAGSLISEKTGKRLDRVTLQDFGRADKVITDDKTTIILGGHGSPADIRARVAQLRRDIEKTYVQYEGKFDRDALQNRLGQLISGVAIISVGAPTKAELEERKMRLEDAASATKAALEEGIVPGGGVALLNVIPALSGMVSEIPDEQVGISVLQRALEEPTRRLAENAGYNGRVVIEEIRRLQAETGDRLLGFDVLSGDYGNLVDRGIIDPAKVTRSAVENAVSVAILILSTEALVADLPEPK